jgi:hypothetical protein
MKQASKWIGMSVLLTVLVLGQSCKKSSNPSTPAAPTATPTFTATTVPPCVNASNTPCTSTYTATPTNTGTPTSTRTVTSTATITLTSTQTNTPVINVTTFAGSGSPGSTNGTGTAASFYSPEGVAVDTTGNVYVADTYNNLIRKITSSGVVSTLAGSGSAGSANGTGTAASFSNPIGVAVDTSGNVYVADTNNNLIREITQ